MAFSFTGLPLNSPKPIKPWTHEDEERLMTFVQLGIQSGEVEESHGCYLAESYDRTFGCAVGHALVGKYGGAKAAIEKYAQGRASPHSFGSDGSYIGMFSKMLDINRNLLQRVSSKHHSGYSISSIMAEMKQGSFV